MSFFHAISFSFFSKEPTIPPHSSGERRQWFGECRFFRILLQTLLTISILFDGILRPDSIARASEAKLSGEPFLQETDLPVLTIDQAVGEALGKNPALARERARMARKKTLAIQAGELPDPKLVLGEQYFPISLNMGQSLLAMTTVGLRQSFSPWGKKALLRQGFLREKTASGWMLEDRKLRLVRDLRLTWMDLYRATRTETLLRSIALLWQKAFQSALARYRQGTGSESDLLFAQFQKDHLKDKEEALQVKKEENLHHLMSLMHRSQAFRIASEEPTFPIPLTESMLLARINRHPALRSSADNNAAQALRVRAARKDKIPAISVEGDYSYFMGPSLITATPNLFSVLLTMNLPVRPGQRQDQKVREEEAILESFESRREELRQKLAEEIRDSESSYRHLSRRELFFDHLLLPEARRNVEAALNDYSTGTVPMGRVLESMKKVEDAELQDLDIRVKKMKEMARLDYFRGRLQGGSNE
ncbi:MAG: TolC family protein [Nitrospirota bacterium]|nr:TolC family protein [Nitrospirota bacterium]